MKRWALLLYGVISYLVLLGTIAYGIGFFGNIFVVRTIDGIAGVPLGSALLVNIGLLLLFALQHSGMARYGFKQWLARIVPKPAIRSTYVWISSVTMIAMMFLWQPMGGVVWSVESQLAREVIMVAYFLGWVLMVWSTFLLDHFEMFGLRQVWCVFRGRGKCVEPHFQTPAVYRFMRHPIYAGWLVIMWASPTMTVTHLVFAIGLTVYTLFGIRLEEQDLQQRLPYYEQYRRKVPMLLPSIRKRLLGRVDQ